MCYTKKGGCLYFNFIKETNTLVLDNHQTKSYNSNKSIQGGYLNLAA